MGFGEAMEFLLLGGQKNIYFPSLLRVMKIHMYVVPVSYHLVLIHDTRA